MQMIGFLHSFQHSLSHTETKGDNEWLCAMKYPKGMNLILTPLEFKPLIQWSEVKSTTHSAIWTFHKKHTHIAK